jgi:hypothetical protein
MSVLIGPAPGFVVFQRDGITYTVRHPSGGHTGAQATREQLDAVAVGAQSAVPLAACLICDAPTSSSVCVMCANVMDRGEPLWMRVLRWVMR